MDRHHQSKALSTEMETWLPITYTWTLSTERRQSQKFPDLGRGPPPRASPVSKLDQNHSYYSQMAKGLPQQHLETGLKCIPLGSTHDVLNHSSEGGMSEFQHLESPGFQKGSQIGRGLEGLPG